jgi:long-chain acyl-CoA synthetase
MRPSTLARYPEYLRTRYPKPVLIRRSRSGGFDDLSTAAFADRIRDLAIGLIDLGFAPGDRAAIISESRPEWTIADFAVLTAGGVVVPIYPTLTAEQVCYILNDAAAHVAFVSTPAQAEKIFAHAGNLPHLRAVVLIDEEGCTASASPALIPMAALVERGRGIAGSDASAVSRRQERMNAVDARDVATIIYTSGTTGQPKGVMLTHANLLSNIEATLAAFPPVTPSDTALSFLPLSHAFERLVLYLYLHCGVTVAFAESMETIARDLRAAQPTLVTGVPRVYEKLHSRILDGVKDAGGLKRALFTWAIGVATARARARLEKRSVPGLIAFQFALADRLVLRKVRDRVGGRLRFFLSGSAPLSEQVAEFFYAIGLPIVEGYGLTETSPILAVNPAEEPRFGSVGKAIPNVDIRIADDGEILARGPNVMRGYLGKPTETAAALADGWFHTGDIGQLDADGYLRITDRKKELIVTAGGKKIAPQPIENQLRADPLIAEAVLVGDRRKFLVALLVPDFAALAARAKQRGVGAGDRAALVSDARIRTLYEQAVERVNDRLSQFERIKKFVLLPREFSVDAGELTPTMKVKRKVVEENYRDRIEELYGSNL